MKKIMFARNRCSPQARCRRARRLRGRLQGGIRRGRSAEKDAGQLRNQWTTTEAAFKAAKKAGDAGNFDQR